MADWRMESQPHRFRCRMTEAVIAQLRATSRNIRLPPRDQRLAGLLADVIGTAYAKVQAEDQPAEERSTGGTK